MESAKLSKFVKKLNGKHAKVLFTYLLFFFYFFFFYNGAIFHLPCWAVFSDNFCFLEYFLISKFILQSGNHFVQVLLATLFQNVYKTYTAQSSSQNIILMFLRVYLANITSISF